MTSAFPSNLRSLSQATAGIHSITIKSDITTPNPLTAHPVSCLNTRHPPTLVPSDCGYVLNYMILQEPNAFQERMFRQNSYRTDAGGYAPSRWQFGNCEVSVFGPKRASQLLTLFAVALTANTIVRECIEDIVHPIGGVSLIGDISAGFHVILQGYDEPEMISAKNPSVSQQSAVRVSRRGLPSQHLPENSAGSQAVEIRDPLMGVSRVANHPAVTSNSSIDAPPARYPVRCFNPFIVHLQPAAATDCDYIINQIILRLSDPTRQLTFGFTDVADINLSKPEYQKWQYGQCMISVKNNDVAQADIFRLLDVATTARRISMQCLVNTQDTVGGVANIGTDRRGFYVYVGGPLTSSTALSDVMLSRESTGAETF